MTTKVLKTLQQHDAEAWEGFEYMQSLARPHPNGIACPRCSEELLDSDNSILTSNPPKRSVHCPGCGYHGYRLA